MLAKIWRKGNTLALLVGMQNDTTTVKNSGKFPQKVKQNHPMIHGSHYCVFTQRYKNAKPKGYMHLYFIGALFTIARLRKQPKGSAINEWIKKMVYVYTHTHTHTHTHIHTMECYSTIKNN